MVKISTLNSEPELFKARSVINSALLRNDLEEESIPEPQ